MKRFIRWLETKISRPKARVVTEQPSDPVSVKPDNITNDDYEIEMSIAPRVPPEGETEGEDRDDFSFSWFGIDQADSSIFDSDSLITEEPEDKDAVSHTTPNLVSDSLCDTEENIGVDPYNTGRIDTRKT